MEDYNYTHEDFPEFGLEFVKDIYIDPKLEPAYRL